MTATYSSTNSRPCASCGQRRNCLNTCPDRDPSVPGQMMFGEIALPDGTTYLYPAETPLFLELPTVRESPLCSDGGNGPDIGTVTGVIRALDKGPQSHAEARSARPPVPVGGLALVMLGLLLMAIGFVMNEPISQLIYGVIHK